MPSAFCCAWRLNRSTDEDSPLRSTQLCSHWTFNVERATGTTPQRWTLCRVRVGEHNFDVIKTTTTTTTTTIIIVFWVQAPLNKLQGNRSERRPLNKRGFRKIRNVRLISHYILEMVQNRLIFLRNVNRELITGTRSTLSVPMTP